MTRPGNADPTDFRRLLATSINTRAVCPTGTTEPADALRRKLADKNPGAWRVLGPAVAPRLTAGSRKKMYAGGPVALSWSVVDGLEEGVGRCGAPVHAFSVLSGGGEGVESVE